MDNAPWGEYPVPEYGDAVLSEDLARGTSICMIDYLSELTEEHPTYAVFAQGKFVRVNPYGFTRGWAIEYDDSPEVVRIDSIDLPARAPNPKAKNVRRPKKSFFPELERGLDFPAIITEKGC